MTQDASLSRFVEAQANVYETALAEIRAGAKRSHWMWYIFPQLRGLGHSSSAHYYGIASLAEARTYLNHPVLGRRYLECVKALQTLGNSEPVAIFGSVDAMKLRSSLTLFDVAGGPTLIDDALEHWFNGERDATTLHLLA